MMAYLRLCCCWRLVFLAVGSLLTIGGNVKATEPQGLIDQLWSPALAGSSGGNLLEKSAHGWACFFITDDCLPPQRCKYVFLPGDTGGKPDMLRMRYSVDECIITLTQTACVFAIEAAFEEFTDGESTQSAQPTESLARRFFRGADDIVLVTKTRHGNRTTGITEIKHRSPRENWLNHVVWWCEANKVGFYFLKRDGHPSAGAKGFAVRLNANWFRGVESRGLGVRP